MKNKYKYLTTDFNQFIKESVDMEYIDFKSKFPVLAMEKELNNVYALVKKGEFRTVSVVGKYDKEGVIGSAVGQIEVNGELYKVNHVSDKLIVYGFPFKTIPQGFMGTAEELADAINKL